MIIIPDVHGRSFWKDAVKGREDEEIIFLGDYVDPYGYEGIFPEDGIACLEDIIKFKELHPKNVHLLLGNHDCGYIWSDVCSARRSRQYYNDISHLFVSNLSLFDLAYTAEINGKKYLFTHAGVHKEWIDKFIDYLGVKVGYDMIDWFLNNTLHCETYNDALETFLGMYSFFRGYTSYEYGSCVWADVRELSNEYDNVKKDKELGYYQIFGHTQLENEPIVKESFACLDVRRYFELTDDNILKDPTHPTGEWEYDLNKISDINNLKKE